ncbi:hypothetical protein PG995_003328 [Apiospora arundinis]
MDSSHVPTDPASSVPGAVGPEWLFSQRHNAVALARYVLNRNAAGVLAYNDQERLWQLIQERLTEGFAQHLDANPPGAVFPFRDVPGMVREMVFAYIGLPAGSQQQHEPDQEEVLSSEMSQLNIQN